MEFKINSDSDSDWTHLNIRIITFATDNQIRWIKMLKKEDLKGCNCYV